jgi:hypothetical protein
MPTYSPRVNAWISGTNTAFSPSATATIVTNLGDTSDATVVDRATTGGVNASLGINTQAIPSTEFVARVAAFLRISNGTSGAAYAGATAYRASDPVPGGVGIVYGDDSLTIRTVQPSAQNVQWNQTDVNNMRIRLTNFCTTTTNEVRMYQAGVNVYTLTKATATVANFTSTQSTPTVSVNATATLDWEATSYDWEKLRLVRVDVRIESGGTTAGTGTLVGEGTAEVLFGATGTLAVSVPTNNALVNGTYRVYARGVRFRDRSFTDVLDDQIGAWSTAGIMTQSVTPPSNPIFNAANAIQDTSSYYLSVRANSSAGYSNPTIDVERNDGSGWVPVRWMTGRPVTFGLSAIERDFEAPRGVEVDYRARVNAVTGGITNSSEWVYIAATGTLTAADWTLKTPLIYDPIDLPNPEVTNNIYALNVVGDINESIDEDLGVFRPLSKRYPIVVAGELTGYDGDLNMVFSGTADVEKFNKLKEIVELQTVVLLQSPFGWQKYLRIMGGIKVSTSGTPSSPVYRVSFSYVEVDMP